MKKLIVFPLLFITFLGFSQIRTGLKVGLNTVSLKAEDFNIIDGGIDRFTVALKEAKYGFHFGLVLEAEIGQFSLQPEVFFSSNSVDLTLEDFQDPGAVVMEEKYNNLDIPILLGYRLLGLFRLNFGPVGHISLNNTSNLTDVEGFKEDFKNMTIGYQAGLGIDIGRIGVDLRYEGNFDKFGSYITFGGEQYAFSQTPNRFLGSVTYRFGGGR